MEVIGAEDKRGCTVTITTCGDGEVLPFQMIFKGKTQASLPKSNRMPEALIAGHDFTVSESHWCTFETLKRWVQKILYPAYVARCVAKDLVVGTQECVLQFDVYKVCHRLVCSFTCCLPVVVLQHVFASFHFHSLDMSCQDNV